MTVIEGVDYAFPPIPSPGALKAAGKKFACRYGGPGSDKKQLHAAELAALRAAGIDVVANAEGAAAGFRGTDAGKNWAKQAKAHFDALGMPAGRPIYFSVDWAADSSDWAQVDAALRGAASVLGASCVGVYGSYATVQHCHSAGTANWFWMTYAWSGGKQPPAYVHLHQYRNGQLIDGADCDLTRALKDDYGQWGYLEEDMELSDKVTNPTTGQDMGRLDGLLSTMADRIGVVYNRTAALNTLPSAADVAKEVLNELKDSGNSDAELAQVLVSLLGDRALSVAQTIVAQHA